MPIRDINDGQTQKLFPGKNVLIEQRGKWIAEPSVDISTRLSEDRIHAIHCHLIERATNGRLTWTRDGEIKRNRP